MKLASLKQSLALESLFTPHISSRENLLGRIKKKENKKTELKIAA